jgi:phosphoribosylformylglycinamidine synthase
VSAATVAVLQFPGVNCETESVRALERAGLHAEVFGWKRPAAELRAFDAFVLPGGFSYQDRVRAGAIAAKDPLIDVLAEAAERGAPVLGICNGAQVLVESGLVPGGANVELALARNRMPDRSGYYARWIYVRIEESPCVFTRHLAVGTVLPLPMAHSEGRFLGEPGRMRDLARNGQTPLRYANSNGGIATEFPALPNGAEESAAAVCNARGNVLAMMPHPERAQDLGAVCRSITGEWASRRARDLARCEDQRLDVGGPGLELFRGLASYLKEC